MKPRTVQLKEKIANIQEQQEFNKKTVAENQLVREQEHEEYEKEVTEYNEATAAVDDALSLVEHLVNPSLV